MLNFLWASPTHSPRKTRAFVVSVSLSSAVYCAGDIVQGTVELSCDDEIDADEATLLEACLELRLHGHLRIDPRWVQLPAPVRKIWGQAAAAVDGASKVSVMPAFAEFSNPNIACIFTTPPASVAAGIALPVQPPAQPQPQPVQEQRERGQRTWRRSFVVALPSAMLPTFRGLGARVFYMATLTVRSPPGAPPLGIHDSSAGQAQSSSASYTHLHLPLTVLASGRGNGDGTATTSSHSSHSSSSGSSSSGINISGGVKSVDLSHVHLATLNEHLVAHSNQVVNEQLPSVSTEPLDLMNRFRLRDDAGSFSATKDRSSLSNGSNGSSKSGCDSSHGHDARAPTLFTIRHGTPKPSTCCTVSLPRCDVTPGASLQVTLDFGKGNAHASAVSAAEQEGGDSSGPARAAAEMNKCLQVAAALIVRESYTGSSSSSGSKDASSNTRGASYDTIIDTAHCFTYHARSCSFLLHVPLDAPLSFKLAGLVSLSYQLTFEFTIATEPPSPLPHHDNHQSSSHSSGASYNPSGALALPPLAGGCTTGGIGNDGRRVEVLAWSTEIKVVPPHSGCSAPLSLPTPTRARSSSYGDSLNQAAPNDEDSPGSGVGAAFAYVLPAAANHSRAWRFTAAAAEVGFNSEGSTFGTGALGDLQSDTWFTQQSASSKNLALLV